METTTAVNNFCYILHCRCSTVFWICLGFWFWIYQGSDAWVIQGSEYAWIITEHVGRCRNMFVCNVPKSHCNPLSTWTCGYLCQCLYKTRSYSLKEYETFFLRRQDFIFPIVGESIWFVLSFRLNVFTRFPITLFNYLCTRLISKSIILLMQKAFRTSLKLSWKVENRNLNVTINFFVAGFLVCFAHFFSWYNIFTLIQGLCNYYFLYLLI